MTVRYGDVLALDGATLRVEAGRVCGLIGMNGSGKSTLFKAIMGMVTSRQRDRADRRRRPGDGTAARRHRLRAAEEDVDWQFPLSVRDVVMTGRYGRDGLHPPRRGPPTTPPSTRRWNGSS